MGIWVGEPPAHEELSGKGQGTVVVARAVGQLKGVVAKVKGVPAAVEVARV